MSELPSEEALDHPFMSLSTLDWLCHQCRKPVEAHRTWHDLARDIRARIALQEQTERERDRLDQTWESAIQGLENELQLAEDEARRQHALAAGLAAALERISHDRGEAQPMGAHSFEIALAALAAYHEAVGS